MKAVGMSELRNVIGPRGMRQMISSWETVLKAWQLLRKRVQLSWKMD